MSFRGRLLLAFVGLALVPLALFAWGVRSEVTDGLTEQQDRRVAALVSVLEQDLERQGTAVAARLDALTSALADDNRFRVAAVRGDGSERAYLLDYAGSSMALAGLSMLQIQDETGRILSSGHFRNEYDRREPALARALARLPAAGLALVEARAPEGPFLALVRSDSLRIGPRRLSLVGGVSVGRPLLERLARDADVAVSLLYPGGALSSDVDLEAALTSREPGSVAAGGGSGVPGRRVVAEVGVPFVGTGAGRSAAGAAPAAGGDTPEPAGEARFVVSRSVLPLEALRRNLDLWFVLGLAVTGGGALLLAAWLSVRISRPLTALAHKTARLDLDRLDLDFESGRSDEVGTLSRVLGEMTDRLRASAGRLREAERRATAGELARQVNHDIRNGLTPIRNVLRHLASLAREAPGELAAAFRDRQDTLDSGISYLDALATNYARISPERERGACDLNSLTRRAVAHAPDGGDVRIRLDLAENLPPVQADEIGLRRVLENLIANGLQSLPDGTGSVTVSTGRAASAGETDSAGKDAATGRAASAGRAAGEAARPDEPRTPVCITVADTGRGMSEEERERIFEDFYTTREEGAGLGLSIVRRLVSDMDGRIRVESEPGLGSRFVVELPPAPGPRSAGAPDRRHRFSAGAPNQIREGSGGAPDDGGRSKA